MIRKTIIVVLTLATILTGIVWAWSVRWQRATGGWEVRVGEVTLRHVGYGYGLRMESGKRPSGTGATRSGDYGFVRWYGGANWVHIRFPYWLPLLTFAAYPTLALLGASLRRFAATDRYGKGLCCKCGYDVRGLPGDKCPECGTTIARQPPRPRSAMLRRLCWMVAISWLAGAWHVFIYWLVMLPLGLKSMLQRRSGIFFEQFFGEFFGGTSGFAFHAAIVGLVWSLFSVPLLVHKPLYRATRIVGWVIVIAVVASFAVAIVGSTYFSAAAAVGGGLLPTAAFLITCVWLRRRLPDVFPSTSCARCGHVLAEDEHDLCPECRYALTLAER
jgi:hypothetical protein